MKTGLKIFLGVIIGFAGGFASGYFFHKKLNDVEFEEVSKEEMALLEQKAIEKEKTEEPISKANVNNVQDLPEDPDKMRMALQGKKSYVEADNEAKERYAKIWNAVKDYSNEENANDMPVESVEEGFDEEFLEMLEEEEVTPGQVEPPHQIGLAEFYNERNEYDKITIDWFEEDDTFIDEKEEVIADIHSYIGNLDIKALFERLDPETDDPDICFVRNEQYGTDYEIIRRHGRYLDTMGGEE